MGGEWWAVVGRSESESTYVPWALGNNRATFPMLLIPLFSFIYLHLICQAPKHQPAFHPRLFAFVAVHCHSRHHVTDPHIYVPHSTSSQRI